MYKSDKKESCKVKCNIILVITIIKLKLITAYELIKYKPSDNIVSN